MKRILQVPQDIRPFVQEALIRRKTAEQAQLRARARRYTQILVFLWATLLVLSYFSVRKFVRILHQLPSHYRGTRHALLCSIHHPQN